MARNRKRAKERRARRPQPVATTRGGREETPDPIAHAAPDVELAEAQLAVGRPETEAEVDPEPEDDERGVAEAMAPEEEEEFEPEPQPIGAGGERDRVRIGAGFDGDPGGGGGGVAAPGAAAAPLPGKDVIHKVAGHRVRYPEEHTGHDHEPDHDPGRLHHLTAIWPLYPL